MWLHLVVLVVYSIPLLHATENNGQISDVIEKRFAEIERQNELLLERNNDLERKLNSFEMKIEKMDKENKALNDRVDVLWKRNDKLERQVLTFQKNCGEKKKTHIWKDIHQFENKHGHFSKGLQKENPLNEKKNIRREMDTKRLLIAASSQPTQSLPTQARVAFHARMSKDLTNPGDSSHIEFGDVMTNTGNAYDGFTGTFTCTFSGTYVFFMTILTNPGKHLDSEFVRNGDRIGVVYSNGGDNYDSGSNMVIVNLQENDRVWMRVNGGNHGSGDVALHTYGTFSGFILWPSQ